MIAFFCQSDKIFLKKIQVLPKILVSWQTPSFNRRPICMVGRLFIWQMVYHALFQKTLPLITAEKPKDTPSIAKQILNLFTLDRPDNLVASIKKPLKLRSFLQSHDLGYGPC
jgi:hypothetical protein